MITAWVWVTEPLMGNACTLTVAEDSVDDATVLLLDGVLDSSTYQSLRDGVIATALEEPLAVVVDVNASFRPSRDGPFGLQQRTVHVNVWPSTPILLVCADPVVVSALHRTGVARRVPVHPTVSAALATLGPCGVKRHRARAVLPADLSSLRRSRALVEQWLTAWTQVGLIPVTQVIITAFVENVLAHPTSWPQVRLETDGTTVTVAVEDDARAQASVRETTHGCERPSGLRIVKALCRHWGNAPTPSGKTVWAVVGPENRL